MKKSQRVLKVSLVLALLGIAVGCAETDQSIYTAGESGISTFTNPLPQSLFLPGCAPYEIQRQLDGDWVDVGPPFVCVWEGIAVRLEPNESLDTAFNAPTDTGLYRHTYSASLGCQLDLPLSQADCQRQQERSTRPYHVERELCDPSEFGCQFVPGAPNFLCEDGINFGGPSGDCTRDPSSGACGYEFLECP